MKSHVGLAFERESVWAITGASAVGHRSSVIGDVGGIIQSITSHLPNATRCCGHIGVREARPRTGPQSVTATHIRW